MIITFVNHLYSGANYNAKKKRIFTCTSTMSGFNFGFLVEVPFRIWHMTHLNASAKRLLYILLQQDQLGLKMRPGFIYDEPMDKEEDRV